MVDFINNYLVHKYLQLLMFLYLCFRREVNLSDFHLFILSPRAGNESNTKHEPPTTPSGPRNLVTNAGIATTA